MNWYVLCHIGSFAAHSLKKEVTLCVPTTNDCTRESCDICAQLMRYWSPFKKNIIDCVTTWTCRTVTSELCVDSARALMLCKATTHSCNLRSWMDCTERLST
jgi:hypothetical protein